MKLANKSSENQMQSVNNSIADIFLLTIVSHNAYSQVDVLNHVGNNASY